jgi:hypothetical protein
VHTARASAVALSDRPSELRQLIGALAGRDRWRVAFIPSAETAFISYFPADLWDDLKPLARAGIEVVPYSDDAGAPPYDIVLLTAHGSDKSPEIWRMRQRFPGALFCTWFWDNHLAQVNNLRTAVATDLAFPSHAYDVGCLVNLEGAVAAHLPPCSAQWSVGMAGALYRQVEAEPRSDRLLVNYVDYSFSWRSALLTRLRQEAPEAEVLLMAPSDRRRYFAKSPARRLREWMGYKSSLLLPVDRDLSTRAFDALLAGQILVRPEAIPDFPQVISAEAETRLGIIRLADLEVETIRAAARLAALRFDEGGFAGARARHEFALSGHMLVHRIVRALGVIRQIAVGELAIDTGAPPNLPFGLYARPK